MIALKTFQRMSRTNLARSMSLKHIQPYSETDSGTNEASSQKIANDLKKFLQQTLDCPSYIAAHIVHNEQELLKVGLSTLKNNATFLQSAAYSNSAIYNYPQILTVHPTILKNRLRICQESQIIAYLRVLYHFEECNSANISILKAYALISDNADVVEGIISRAQYPWEGEILTERHGLDEIYLAAMKAYLKHKLRFTDDTILNKIKYYHVHDLSLQALKVNIFFLLNFAGFTKEMVVNNFRFLKYMSSGSLSKLMTYYQSKGCNFSQFLHRKPVLLTLLESEAREIISVLEEFEVPYDVTLETPKIFTLLPDDLRERLKIICSHKELEVFKFHPRFLELPLNIDYVMKQYEWFQQVGFRKLSLSLLLDPPSEHNLRTKKTGVYDLVYYLTKALGRPESEIVAKLNRHPHWTSVPIIQADETFKFLIDRDFSIKDIYNSVHIVLYPRIRVEFELLSLSQRCQTECREILEPSSPGVKKATRVKREHVLPLLLYFIEKDSNFSYDGIWTERLFSGEEDEDELYHAIQDPPAYTDFPDSPDSPAYPDSSDSSDSPDSPDPPDPNFVKEVSPKAHPKSSSEHAQLAT